MVYLYNVQLQIIDLNILVNHMYLTYFGSIVLLKKGMKFEDHPFGTLKVSNIKSQEHMGIFHVRVYVNWTINENISTTVVNKQIKMVTSKV